MQVFTAYYFEHTPFTSKWCVISAPTRAKAINKFEELYPRYMLVSLK